MDNIQDRLLHILEMELTSLKKHGVRFIPVSNQFHSIIKNIVNPNAKIDEPISDNMQKIILPESNKNEQYKWLQQKVLNCPICNKHVKPGKHIVFGIGNLNADIFFCGEAPGADEEIQGLPFVGRAGQLLTKIIQAMNLQRDDVYIANIMNWRPEMPTDVGNRPPTQEEMECCLPYLLAQIDIVQPKAIVALGATAVNGLLGKDPSRRMHDIRGKWMTFHNIPLIATFHPSYLLRNNTNTTKRLVWEDMLSVMKKTKLPITEKQQNYFL